MKVWLLALLPTATWATYNFECNLYCYNDGSCKHGKGKFGSFAGFEEDSKMTWEHHENEKQGMYCSCPVGYTGLQCEIALKVCEGYEHQCFNGKECAKERAGTGEIYYRCECDPEHSVMTADYAGSYCEHLSTIFCDGVIGSMTYCLNGGKCKDRTDSNQGVGHAGCYCTDGYEGKHCQDLIENFFDLEAIAKKATSAKTMSIIGACLVGVVLAVTGFLYTKDKKRKKKERKRTRRAFRPQPEAEMT